MTKEFLVVDGQPQLKAGLYQHYKGPKYQVIGLVRHSENEQWLVCYQALYGDYGHWVRPYDMFTSTVINEDGQSVKRFQLIEQPD